MMNNETMLNNKVANYFDEEQELLALIPLHKWLLISAGVLIFIVLPMLFIWSSLGLIHPRGYEIGGLFSDVGYSDQSSSVFNEQRQLGTH